MKSKGIVRILVAEFRNGAMTNPLPSPFMMDSDAPHTISEEFGSLYLNQFTE